MQMLDSKDKTLFDFSAGNTEQCVMGCPKIVHTMGSSSDINLLLHHLLLFVLFKVQLQEYVSVQGLPFTSTGIAHTQVFLGPWWTVNVSSDITQISV